MEDYAMCALIQLPGFYGITTGVVIFITMWTVIWFKVGKGPFDMDPLGEKGAFLPLLSNYIDISKFVIGLASASIAALIGGTVFRTEGKAGPLLINFASPLFLVALSLILGVLFIAFIAHNYEDYRHNNPARSGVLSTYTRFRYSRNTALGFGCLFCFALGYISLIFVVLRQN
jgi:hypothetical protein